MEAKKGRWGLLSTQAVLCAVIVAAALVLRLVGGNLFEELRAMFCTAVQDDALGVALLERWQSSVSL